MYSIEINPSELPLQWPNTVITSHKIVAMVTGYVAKVGYYRNREIGARRQKERSPCLLDMDALEKAKEF